MNTEAEVTLARRPTSACAAEHC